MNSNDVSTALKLIDEQHFSQAESILKKLVRSGVKSADAYMALGDCARKQGNILKTEKWYEAAVDTDPKNFVAQSNYGLILRMVKDYKRAEIHCRTATEINPNSSQAQGNLGLVLLESGNYRDAAVCFSQALKCGARDIPNHCYLIRALYLSNQIDQALHAQETLLAQFPASDVCFNALGIIYQDIGDETRAKDFYVKALRIQPDNAEAHYNLGTIMRQWNKLDEALICFTNSIRFNAGNIMTHVNMGEVFQIMGEHEKAQRCFRDALEIDPKCTIAYDNILVSMNYNPCCTNRMLYDAHVQWGKSVLSKIKPWVFKPEASGGRKIRIGYVSPDFCKHPAASFLEPVIANHDRSRFDIYCYYERRYDDERTQRFRTLADSWRETTGLSDPDAVQMIRNDNIDILIDCAGHMAGNRLGIFAHRGAPVQITGFGYPSTTGLATIDYRITDHLTDPVDAPGIYSETPLRLDRGFFCYMPPADAPEVSALPCVKRGYMTFGSMHTTARLNRDVIALWADTLNAVEGSRLILFRTTLTQSIVARLVQWFWEAGIEKDRVDIVNSTNSGSYLSVYQNIDCSLDTFPWSGHTTACESLWMGVPMITLTGDRHAGRMVTSLLERTGCAEFIAHSRDEYIRIAQSIDTHREQLEQLRTSLRSRMLNSTVCNAVQWVRSFEKMIDQIWNQWCYHQK